MKFASLVSAVVSVHALEDAFLREEDEVVMLVTQMDKKAKHTASVATSSVASSSASKHHKHHSANTTAPANGAEQTPAAIAAGLVAVVAGLL